MARESPKLLQYVKRVEFQCLDYFLPDYEMSIGAPPHEAKSYTPAVESEMLTAPSHQSCQRVFTQQLRIAVDRGIPNTVRTRQAEEDKERIMKEIMPKDHRVHIHCFTDTATFGLRLPRVLPKSPHRCDGGTTFADQEVIAPRTSILRLNLHHDPNLVRIAPQNQTVGFLSPNQTPITILPQEPPQVSPVIPSDPIEE
ncbi:uncharacterized protein ARMOST_00250 [Armillaria ostoyae]|uniref:Uncharacterized protein n=1 Tax=Armillaria ostoyae TaxID=47428 RepID=A0A284QKK9_ARMOS|nr:uncharacterized protein ARMOST_00250 [Armillaria ostoyae]